MALDAVSPLRMIVAWRRPIGLVANRTLALGQGNLRVVHLGRADLPAGCAVTGGAIRRRRNVARRLSRGDLVIVTGDAAGSRLAMVHTQQRQPGKRSVTCLARIASGWMIGGLARHHDPIVTTDAR